MNMPSKAQILVLGLFAAGLLVLGGGAVWWQVHQADRHLRNEALAQAERVAGAINHQRLQGLSGSATDVASPLYQRLKDQLRAVRAHDPRYRFVYLMRRGSDGSIAILVDSEPVESPDHSPPGQIYSEATEAFHGAFAARRPAVVGPYTDRRGSWVTPLVQIRDPQSATVLAVLGLDVDARDWQRALVNAALPPALTTLALLIILAIGWWRLVHRPGRTSPGLGLGIFWLIAASGLALTACAAWVTRTEELRQRCETFQILAEARVGALETAFRMLRDVELEGLAMFLERADTCTLEEFSAYTSFLARNRGVQAWEWAPAVPAAEVANCEASAHAEGLQGFRIWQRDPGGARIPVAGREIYFPVRLAKPDAGNEEALGYDLGSEPLRRAALAAAASSRVATGTEPVTLVQTSGSQQGMLICRPVFAPDDANRLRGYVLAVLRFRDALACAPSDDLVSTSLVLARPDGGREHLAGTFDQSPSASCGPEFARPINAFGKTFIAAAQAGPEFLGQQSTWGWQLVAAVGAVLSLGTGLLAKRIVLNRLWLERQVHDRTRALQDERARLASIIRGTDAGTWEWDVRTGKIVCNQRWAGMLGYELAELAPLSVESWKRLVHPDDGFEVDRRVQAHFTGATDAYDCDCRLRHKDGSWVWIHARGRLEERAADGTPLMMRGIHIDISERKQAEQRLLAQQASLHEIQTRQAAMIANISDVIGIVGADGIMTYTSPNIERLFGWRPEERVGTSGFATVHPDDLAQVQQLFLTLLERDGQTLTMEFRYACKDGTYKPIHLAATNLVNDANVRGVLINYHDITAAKQAEQRLLETNLELEHQTAIANDMAARAEMASAAKSAFLANMSHEIRTPMNGILGMTELLLGTALNAEQEDYARTAYSSAESLLILLNDILDFSKIDAGKLSLESIPFAPASSLYEIVDLFRPRIAGSTVDLLVRVAPDVPPRVLGDPGRWRQILSNLVGNALKFTTQGHVLLDLSWRDGETVLAISDTGIGIPPERAARLFAPFVQADDSTHRRFGGTGLGLAISRRLAELMGGRITLDSAEGRGSTFTVSVPFAPAPGPAPKAEALQRLEGLRILVIDDSELNCRIVCEQLAMLGARPESETCAPLAVATLCTAANSAAPFAAAIVDLTMPDLDGLAVAATVLADPATRDIPLVLLTSSGAKGDAQRMAEVGFAGYLVKPVRLEVLGAVVGTAVAHRQQGLRDLVTRHSVREASGLAKGLSGSALAGRVLLVEDNLANQKLAHIMLGHLGVAVTVAADGQEALDLLAAQPFDVVLMDCQMPVMDGYETTAALRAREARDGRPRLPVIAMTANALAGDREKCLAAGMDDHIAKPVRERDLAETLWRWLPARPPQQG